MTDWHPEDVKAAIRKQGETIASLARRAGLSKQVVSAAIQSRSSERAERIVAQCIGVSASKIWPSRYRANGSRIRYVKRGETERSVAA